MKRKIAVITHKNPDYDALCSSSSLATYLRKISNENEVYLILEKSKNIDSLFGNIQYYSLKDVEGITFDSIYVCDVNEEDRTYGAELISTISKSSRFLVDHHDKNRKELDIPVENRTIKPTYSSTCEILVEILDSSLLEFETVQNLFMGILSDTACLTRNVSSNTNLMISKLGLQEADRIESIQRVCSLSEEQQELYSRVEALELGIPRVKGYVLFHDNDITSLIKHPRFDDLTKPTCEFPVSIFVIGIQNNFFIKFKKMEDCDINILEFATACNGGGHENRCSGRFYGTTYEEVLNILHNLLTKSPKQYVKKED